MIDPRVEQLAKALANLEKAERDSIDPHADPADAQRRKAHWSVVVARLRLELGQ